MRAIVIDGVGSSSVAERPRPAPSPGEVVVAVERVQLSVTECGLYRGEEIAHYEAFRERLAAGEERFFGHEFCGRAESVGDGVDGVEPGDRVYAPGKVPCDDCAYCDRGVHHLCDRKEGIGYERAGALAEYAALPASALSTLPESVSAAEGAAMQPFASALLCVIDAGVEPGDAVAVVGTGVMGYQCGQLARLFGAGEVFAVDVRPQPLELAGRRGMTPIDASGTDPAEAVAGATDGIGADVVFAAVGGDQTHATSGTDPLAGAFRTVRRGGTVTQVGHVAGEITVTPRELRSNYVSWVNPRTGVAPIGPNATTGELAPRLVADGRASIGEYVTHELDGLDAFEEAVEITIGKVDHDALGPAQIVVGRG